MNLRFTVNVPNTFSLKFLIWIQKHCRFKYQRKKHQLNMNVMKCILEKHHVSARGNLRFSIALSSTTIYNSLYPTIFNGSRRASGAFPLNRLNVLQLIAADFYCD